MEKKKYRIEFFPDFDLEKGATPYFHRGRSEYELSFFQSLKQPVEKS